MRTLLATTVVMVLAATAFGDVFIPGEFNGWDNVNFPMTETSPNFFEYDVVDFTDAEWPTQFVLLRYAGDWSDASKYIPSGDQWNATDATSYTITFDLNTYDDGWYPQTNRVGFAGAGVWNANWTAVGDWQGWDNGNAATAMADMGGGVYMFETTGLSAGEHWYKACRTGTWNAIGGDGVSVNADNFGFMVGDPSEIVQFYVDAAHGVISVNVIPEPAALALLALGGLLAIRRR